ncbi:hypothetical protein [Tissierella sp.]|uniref:hypothetical protein n=1 Tax=Tissierella sp. TaxID=41274 RepID=UPI0030389F27
MEKESKGFWGFLSNVLSDKFKTEYGKINYRTALALIIIAAIYLFYQYKMTLVYVTYLNKEFELMTFYQLLKPAFYEIAFCLIYISILVYMERKLKKKNTLW